MFRLRTYLLPAIVAVSSVANVDACPFCSAVSQTFSEEIATMDVVAIAELQEAGEISKLSTSDPQAEVPKSTFVITDVIKGDQFIEQADTFQTIYFGEAKKNRSFLAMATDAPNLMWSTPLILTERAREYLGKLGTLPEGHERLAFFQDYLEDEDEMLARDAYDEFAKAPYADVISLKPKMDREKLVAFVKDRDVPSNRRRLYFTMLGVCGTKTEANLLEGFMESDDRKAKAGLDSMLACYMILKGEQGLDRVDELFLKNKAAEYADTYAAIMAIRFHGSEIDVIPRTRLVKSLRHMLDRPELADLVIPDLARWEDWDVMPRLVDLFIAADENSSWVRVPVINYLRACPRPTAAERIEDLKKVDADAVKRAMTFFPLTPEKKDESKETGPKASGDPKVNADEPKPVPAAASVSEPTDAQSLAINPAISYQGAGEGQVAQASGAPEAEVPSATTAKQIKQTKSVVSINTPDTLTQVESAAETEVNIWVLLGVTSLAGCLCFTAMRSILGLTSRGTA